MYKIIEAECITLKCTYKSEKKCIEKRIFDFHAGVAAAREREASAERHSTITRYHRSGIQLATATTPQSKTWMGKRMDIEIRPR